MPFGVFDGFASLSVLPDLACGQPQVGDGGIAARGVADLGIGAQVTDQDDLVDSTIMDGISMRAPSLARY